MKQEMGIGNSLLSPQCSVPLRNYIDVLGKMEEVSILCSQEKLYWSLGLTSVLTVGLYFIQRYQKEQEEESTVLPDWIVYLPLLYGLYLIFFVNADSKYMIETEKIRFQTSGVSETNLNPSKEKFLALRSNEEARIQGIRSGLTNAAIVSATGLYGPFFRGV